MLFEMHCYQDLHRYPYYAPLKPSVFFTGFVDSVTAVADHVWEIIFRTEFLCFISSPPGGKRYEISRLL